MPSKFVPRAVAALAAVPLVFGVASAGAALSAAPAAAATVINVPANRPTIQAAIDASANGDQIVVAPGTYSENINFHGKAVEVKSAQGPGVTTIDGRAADSVVTFNAGEGTTSILRGFTVTNGNAQFDGGGVRIAGSSPTIVGNVITGNHACSGGAGVQASGSNAVIQDNTISQNTQVGCSGGDGGGVEIIGAGAVQLLHNTISDNTFSDGAGVSLFAAGTPTILNNQVINNTATIEGAGFEIVNGSDAAITQNVISGNHGGAGVELVVPQGDRGAFFVNNTITGNGGPGIHTSYFASSVQIWNNILANNTGAQVVCDNTGDPTPPQFHNNDAFGSGGDYTGTCAGTTGTNGNISADPMFAAPGDFHLSSTSPAINHGSNSAPGLPSADIDGQARIAGGTVDQGVDEFVATVQGPPSAPQNVTVVRDATGGGVTISWQAPASNGGSPITGYKVRILPEDRLIKVGPTTFSIHVLGVARNTSHTIAVVATNANGAGPAAQVRLPASR